MRKQTKLILGGVATLTLAVGVAFLAGWILSAMRSDEKRGIATGDVLGMQFAMRGFLTKERLHLLAPNGADKILDHRETKRLLEAMTGAVNELNPSGLVYWWPTESQRKAGKIEDPWGKDYRIALDGDRDGRIVTTCCGEIVTTESAVIWSDGEGPVASWQYARSLPGSSTKPVSRQTN